jgi:hypothetical protein
MNKKMMVRSPSMDLSQFVSQEPFDDFEKCSKGISPKVMRKMGYNGHGIRNINQEIVNPL